MSRVQVDLGTCRALLRFFLCNGPLMSTSFCPCRCPAVGTPLRKNDGGTAPMAHREAAAAAVDHFRRDGQHGDRQWCSRCGCHSIYCLTDGGVQRANVDNGVGSSSMLPVRLDTRSLDDVIVFNIDAIQHWSCGEVLRQVVVQPLLPGEF